MTTVHVSLDLKEGVISRFRREIYQKFASSDYRVVRWTAQESRTAGLGRLAAELRMMQREGLASRWNKIVDYTGSENHLLIAELTPEGRSAMREALSKS